jgi:hypothetical protein
MADVPLPAKAHRPDGRNARTAQTSTGRTRSMNPLLGLFLFVADECPAMNRVKPSIAASAPVGVQMNPSSDPVLPSMSPSSLGDGTRALWTSESEWFHGISHDRSIAEPLVGFSTATADPFTCWLPQDREWFLIKRHKGFRGRGGPADINTLL